MKERELSFTRNTDETIVQDPDGKMIKSIKKIYSNLASNLGFCYEQLEEGKLTEGMRETHLSLSESYLTEFLKEMNYDSILTKEKEKRYTEIRGLNDENRRLRKIIGEKVSNEDVRERIKNIKDQIWMWWNINGFGHISDFSISESGYIMLTLSGMITEPYRSKEKTKEEKINELSKIGFEFNDDDEVIFSDASVDLLKTLITTKYPSAIITEMKINLRRNKRSYREVLVIITDLNDFNQ